MSAQTGQTETQGLVELFSQEWVDKAKELWAEVVTPNLVEPETYDYIMEFGVIDGDAVCTIRPEQGRPVEAVAGKKYSDEECGFILYATKDIWRKVAAGELDPVAAVASKRIHLRKGPMAVVIKEADPTKQFLSGFGRIPTNW